MAKKRNWTKGERAVLADGTVVTVLDPNHRGKGTVLVSKPGDCQDVLHHWSLEELPPEPLSASEVVAAVMSDDERAASTASSSSAPYGPDNPEPQPRNAAGELILPPSSKPGDELQPIKAVKYGPSIPADIPELVLHPMGNGKPKAAQ